MRVVLTAVVLAILAPGLSATEPSETVLLQARIAQLEAQLADAATQLQVCTARLMVSMQPQTQQAQSQQRAKIEKDAGCALDWSVTPPVCKPVYPAPAKGGTR